MRPSGGSWPSPRSYRSPTTPEARLTMRGRRRSLANFGRPIRKTEKSSGSLGSRKSDAYFAKRGQDMNIKSKLAVIVTASAACLLSTLANSWAQTDGNAGAEQQVRKAEEERRSEEHTSELQSQSNVVCRLLIEKQKIADALPKHFKRRPIMQVLSVIDFVAQIHP